MNNYTANIIRDKAIELLKENKFNEALILVEDLCGKSSKTDIRYIEDKIHNNDRNYSPTVELASLIMRNTIK